ncbi:MAG: transcription elongation factor GreA [Bdellovibrionales bacterium]|nr:transcription elongation factor GreA [Bdellovibrionales bacterium]
MSDQLPITVRGKKKLEEELKRLIHEERPSVIRAIEEARAQGDLSENADYDAAKERQGWIEARINEIQSRIAGAEVIDPSKIKSDRIVFGATVKLLDMETDKEVEYNIVGPEEADVSNGYISILSPLVRVLVGKKVGDVVELSAAKAQKEYEVLGISFK